MKTGNDNRLFMGDRRRGLRLLHQGQGGGITYLLLDRFTTDAAAPLASPRTAEPGPGTLTLVQTDGQFSIVSGALNFPAQGTPVDGDQGFYSSNGFARLAGRALITTMRLSTMSGSDAGGVAWKQVQDAAMGTASSRWGIAMGNAGLLLIRTDTSGSFQVGAATTGVDYQLAIILRDSGAFYLIKGGAFAEWTLIWVSSIAAAATVYVAFGNLSNVGTLD